MEQIIITNDKIITFYSKYKNLNIIDINLQLIDLFESILNSNDIKENKILSILNNQSAELQNILLLVKSNDTQINNLKHELINKIYETKIDYINEIQNLLKLDQSDIKLSINNYNDILINKISNIIPKSNDQIYDNILCEFKKDLTSSLDKLINEKPERNLEYITIAINEKYNSLANILNNNLFQTEQRITTNINQLNQLGTKNMTLHEKIDEKISIHFDKYNNSSQKGYLGETHLYNILLKLFPTAEIKNATKLSKQGDFILNRKEKPLLLIENKDYKDNIPKSEIEKFLRDCIECDSHGVFISQKSGIVNKDNYQIDLHNGKILMYIHKMDYDENKLFLAINTIDLIFDKLSSLDNKSIINIDTKKLHNINQEYQKFIISKDKLITDIKDFSKKAIDNINAMKYSELESILSKNYANNKKLIHICPICNKYESENLLSISRHKPACLKKHTAMMK